MHVRYVFPVEQMAGRDGHPGGRVYFRLNNLDVSRRWVKPANPQTSAQRQIRSILTQAAQAFQNISDSERQTWRAYAQAHPRSYLGQEFTLQEMAAFVQINTIRLIDGQAISNTAPSIDPAFIATGISNLQYDSNNDVLSFTLAHTGEAGSGYWMIKITPALASPQRHARPSDYRLAAGVNASSIIEVDNSPQSVSISNPVFSWSNGDYVQLLILPLSTQYSIGTPFVHRGQITVV